MSKRRIILWIVCFCLIVCFFNQRNTLKSYEGKLDSLEYQNIRLRQEREQLRGEVFELEDSIFYYSNLVNEINIKIEKLKYKRDEKMDTIVDLPLDRSVEFLSRYLPQDCGY